MRKSQFKQIVRFIVEELRTSSVQELNMKADPSITFKAEPKTFNYWGAGDKFHYYFNVGNKNYTLYFHKFNKLSEIENFKSFNNIRQNREGWEQISKEVNNFLAENNVYEITLERLNTNQWRFGMQSDLGHDAIKVYSQMLKGIASFIEQNKPDALLFVPAEDAQGEIYKKFINRFLSKYDYVQLHENPFSKKPLVDEFIFVKKGLFNV